jgi:hypothetical protein
VKLRKVLKLITLKDHQWHLRSSNHTYADVVKVYCVEFCKAFGSTIGNHSKSITTSLSNYKKCHLMSNIQFEIGAKEREPNLVIIPNHKPLKVMTAIDHQALRYCSVRTTT